MNIRRIITSFLVLGVVAIAGVGASRAFFSDTEESLGNSFTAGSIDLTVEGFFDNTGPNGFTLPAESTAFFAFTDLKPGDDGEGRVAISATSNEYWACARVNNLEDLDNTLTEPETDVPDPDGLASGELDSYLQIAIWDDANDNGLFDGGETQLGGSPFSADTLSTTSWLPLADSTGFGPFGNTPLTPTTVHSIGMGYCFGTFDGSLNCTPPAGDQNDAQTDSFSGDLEFYAVQSRNNNDFDCSELVLPTAQPEPTSPSA